MTKDQALLNFQAVQNYLMWRCVDHICTTIDQANNYFECRVCFDPNEWSVEILQDEIESILDAEAKVNSSTIRSSEKMCLTIDWNYQ